MAEEKLRTQEWEQIFTKVDEKLTHLLKLVSVSENCRQTTEAKQ